MSTTVEPTSDRSPAAPRGFDFTGALAPLLVDDRPVPRRTLIISAVIVSLLYALLWCPNWYPLSDSALYMTLGRALANGHGYTNMGEVHQLARPLTPLLVAGVIKLGLGVGTLHALMIALMLIAHGLIYLTLRRWLTERIALVATLGGAASYWVYLNAMTVMTEPLFLVMFWGALLALSYVPGKTARTQWVFVALGLLLMVLAWDTRVAVALLLPCALAGLWMVTRRETPASRRLLWVTLFFVVFAGLAWNYLPPERQTRYLAQVESMFGSRPPVVATSLPTTLAAAQPEVPSDSGSEDDAARPKSEHYRFLFLHGMKHPLIELPLTGGRWICEGLAAASEYIFPKPASPDSTSAVRETPNGNYPDPDVGAHEASSSIVHAFGYVVAVGALLLFALGWLGLLKQHRWWVISIALYFVPIWLQWGVRVKPRYMIPIAPILFILLWMGLTIVANRLFRLLGRTPDRPQHPLGAAVGVALLTVLVIGNAPPYAVEFYLRHVSSVPFYDRSRRGAFSEMVDISAYLETHAAAHEHVWCNRGAMRRVIGFMSGRPIEVREPQLEVGADGSLLPATFPSTNEKASETPLLLVSSSTAPTTDRAVATTQPASQPAGHHHGRGVVAAVDPAPHSRESEDREREKFLHRVATEHGRYAIVFSDRVRWPEWHLPMEPRAGHAKPSWWKLYEIAEDGTAHEVMVPHADPEFIRDIPPSAY